MSQRLTKVLRHTIAMAIEKAYIHHNPAPTAKLPADYRAELIKSLEEEFGKRTAALEEKAAKAGLTGHMVRNDYQYFFVGSDKFHLVYSADKCRLNPNSQTVCQLDTTSDPVWSALWGKYQKSIRGCKSAVDAYKAWELEKNNYMDQVHLLLGSCTTTKRLLEAWPEVHPYIPREVAPVSTAVSVNVNYLRSKL